LRRPALLFSTVIALAFAGISPASAATVEVQPTVEDMVRNVQLRNVLNVRDLGGLRGSRGFIPHERFYRAATLVHASGEDRSILLGRGVTLDIDLRSFVEATQKPDRVARDRRFAYTRISLLDVEDWFRRGGLRGLYLHALEGHHRAFREVFHAMATYQGGAILYHCTSGKDRTGMVTALLLDLAGVARDAIIRDYAISAHYLGRAMTNSPPDAIAAFLDALHVKYGGARAFLAHIGLSEADVHALLVKLGQA
jgi:protein-tyrosine phosphatase